MVITRTFTGRFANASPNEAYSNDDGRTWRWTKNHTVIPLKTCRDYGIPCEPVAQHIAWYTELDRAAAACQRLTR